MRTNDRKRRGKENRGGWGHRGFTLVELIVTLALLAILVSFSVGGILAYQEYASFKKNNDSARTVFNAAQSALAFYKGSGRLESLERQMTAFQQTVPSNASQAAQEGRLSYLTLKKSTGENVLENCGEEGSASPQEKLLFNLLRDYITDDTVYQAAICVEFDPADGVVSGVFYCDRAESFAYGSENGNDPMDIGGDRSEEERKGKSLGYYGTDISDRAPGNQTKLTFEDVELVNQETLDLQWTMGSRYKSGMGEYTYQIQLFQGEETEPKVRIDLQPNEFGVLGFSREDGENAYMEDVPVTLYGEDGAEKKFTAKFHIYFTEEGKISLTLDAVDLGMAQISEEATQEDQLAAVRATFSGRRLGCMEDGIRYGLNLDGKTNISAQMIASARNYKTSDKARSKNSENLLVATGEPVEETEEEQEPENRFNLANARHLYNVRFLEEENPGTEEVIYQITEDFGWGGSEANCLLSYQTNRQGLEDQSEEGVSSTYTKCFQNTMTIGLVNGEARYPAFPSIRQLKAGSRLLGVANQSEDGESQEGEQEPEEVRTLTGFALEPELQQGIPADNVGLVQRNSGTVENIKLENVDVRGARAAAEGQEESQSYSVNNVGAICGYNEGVLSAVGTAGGSVIGGSYVGGIVGRNTGTDLDDLTNEASVSGFAYTGGIVGAAEGFSLHRCTNRGLITGRLPITQEEMEREHSLYIGGITGYADSGQATANIEDCVSTQEPPQTEEEEAYHFPSGMEGSYAGGIVGYLTGTAAVTNCHTDGGVVLGKYVVGGIVGYRDGSGTVTAGEENYNRAEVAGKGFIGGIVGINGKISERVQASPDEITPGDFIAAENELTISGWSNEGRVLAISTEEETTGIRAGFTGGIAGANTGVIDQCQVTEAQGEPYLPEELAVLTQYADYVGGVVGYNNGTVRVEKNQPREITVNVTGGNYLGGVAGYNDEKGEIGAFRLVESQVIGSGSGSTCVGGIAGFTRGPIKNCQSDQLSIIRGGKNVGGIAGRAGVGAEVLDGDYILFENNTNGGEVTALEGSAGGITAIIEEPLNSKVNPVIRLCTNTGTVVSQDQEPQGLTDQEGNEIPSQPGNAGGITGALPETGKISECTVGGVIQAHKGNAGGISGVSYGSVEKASSTAQIIGGEDAGGILGVNYGSVDSCIFRGSVRGTGNTGGIAGDNLGAVTRCSLEKEGSQVHIYATGGNIGGLVGRNGGTISACGAKEAPEEKQNQVTEEKGAYAVLIESVKDEHAAVNPSGNLGGLVGENTATGLIYSSQAGVAAEETGRSATAASNWLIQSADRDIEKENQGSVYVGGCIGYMETMSIVTLSEWNNFADISGGSGTAAAGGIIGRLQGGQVTGFTLEKASNGGVLSAKGDTQAAGILASIGSESLETVIAVNDCVNFGAVRGALASGILGSPDTDIAETGIRISNCVNLGDIPTGAGIYLSMEEDGMPGYVSATIENCRNYYPGPETFAGIYAMGVYQLNDQGEWEGKLDFARTPASTIAITGCFGLEGEMEYPIAPRQVCLSEQGVEDEYVKNNYYFVKEENFVANEPENGDKIGKGYPFGAALGTYFPSIEENMADFEAAVTKDPGGVWSLEETLLWSLSQESVYTDRRVPFYAAVDPFLKKCCENGAVDQATAPVLSETYELGEDDMALFSWDVTAEGPEEGFYNVSLYGVNQDQSQETLLESIEGVLGNTLEVDASGWSTEQLRLEVTKVETQENAGRMIRQEAKGEQIYQRQIRLAQMEAPEVTRVAKDGESLPEEDIFYQIQWGLPEDIRGIAGYQVWADAGNEEPIWIASVTDPKQTEVTVDLEHGEENLSGQNIFLYVNAIADTQPKDENGTQIYLDAHQGLETEIQVPYRMSQPVIPENGFSPVFNTGETLSGQEFDLLDLMLNLEDYSGHQGYYVLAAGIYDSSEIAEGKPVGNLLSGGTIYDNETELFPEGELAGAAYHFTGMDRSWGGASLFVRVKAAGDNAIDSAWSEYAVYRLPEVEMDAPELTADTNEKLWEKGETISGSGTKETRQEDVRLTHTVLSWELMEDAGAYQADIYALDQVMSGEEPSRTPTLTIKIAGEKETGYYMERKTTEKEKEEYRKKNPDMEPPETVSYEIERNKDLEKEEYDSNVIEKAYSLELTEDYLGTNRYQYTYGGLYQGINYELGNICGEIRILEYKNGYREILLFLPDLTAPYQDYLSHIVTQAVSVTALPKEEDTRRESKPSQWIRLYRLESLSQDGQWVLGDYFRRLKPMEDGEIYYDLGYEQERDYDSQWAILPRNAGEIHIIDPGVTAADLFALEPQMEGDPEEYGDTVFMEGDGEDVYYDEGSVVVEGEDIPETDGEGEPEPDTEVMTEPFTEEHTEETAGEETAETYSEAPAEVYSEEPGEEVLASGHGLVGIDTVNREGYSHE